MEHKGLIPNESYEIFIIGDNITNYLHFPHILDHTCGNMSVMIVILSQLYILQFG